ncbi:MAG: 4-hydroxy-tetrahydrodipicolinate synthase [Ruminococcus sp.]|nr:4-hydroxy-tetrahydrodipicolinate synthase [Ruminococcus sp.]
MKDTIFTGAGVAIVTPMDDEGFVNYEEFECLIDFNIANGTDAIIVCGTTGESATLSFLEHCDVVKHCIDYVAGRVPVIAGTGSNDTNFAIRLSKKACEYGADGLLIVTPYYNKASQRGLIKHFTAIADAVDKPIIIYSVASRTGVNIEPATCLELSKHKNIVAIKEASGNISQVAKIRALCGDELNVYSGNDDQIVPMMALGAKGVISVLSNVMPKETHMIAKYCLDGEYDKALKLSLDTLDLANGLFCDVNPIPVKEALNIMGFNAGSCRLPLCDMDDEKKSFLKGILDKHQLVGSIR